MKRWLEWGIRFRPENDYIAVSLDEKTQVEKKEGDNPFDTGKWPTTVTVGSEIIRIYKPGFIVSRRMSLDECNKAVADAKDRLFKRYQKSRSFNDMLTKLCAEWSEPRYLVDDPKVHEIVQTFAGGKKP
jgi:hypothetical protein